LNRSGIKTSSGNAKDVFDLYRQALSDLEASLPDIFDRHDDFIIDPASLAYIDQRLDNIEIDDPARDPFGDLYETFLGNQVRGQEGQFFTPQNAVELLVSLVDPHVGENIIDPACGAGGFLSAAVRHLAKRGQPPQESVAHVFGIDKDRYLADLAASRLALAALSQSNVFCADSLAWKSEERDFPLKDKIGSFDVVLTNPPFGSRIVAVSQETQRLFDLGYKWKFDARKNSFARTGVLQSSVSPQIFFIERCLSLVRRGGRVGMVVPESLISNKNTRHVVQYIRERADILAVIGAPESLFKISGKGGTHTKTCLLYFQKKTEPEDRHTSKIFMAEAQWCGHDSRGRQINRDEFPEIAKRYNDHIKNSLDEHSHLGYLISDDQISDNILAPRYYNPDVIAEVERLKDTHELWRMSDLIDSGIIQITTGDEVGKLAYGTGDVPFVRTSDISNWEVKLDPKHGVSEEIYRSLAAKQDVREGDILMVRDGTYLIGTCAYITKYDTRIVFQSHLYKLRVTDCLKISPYLLLAALSSAPVRRQIKAKRFTQDIIDTLGDRIRELILPIPKDNSIRERVTDMVERSIQERIEARELARRACLELVGASTMSDEEMD
jgi:type I restriction enzyme M protein